MSSKMQCSACSEIIVEDSDLLRCSGNCKLDFHYLCGGQTEKSFRKLSKEKKQSWKCCACLNETKISTRSATNSSANTDTDTINNIQQQNNELKEYISSKLAEFSISIEFNSSVVQDLKKTIIELQSMNKNLEARNEQLTTENIEIKQEVKELKLAVIELKQYSRRTNLEISNLPETDNENIKEVLARIDDLSSTDILENLIVAHRVPSFNKEKPKPLIIQVKTKLIRDELLKKLKNRKLQASEINSRFPEMPVFVNEHLTPELKQLFYHARKYKKDKEFQFCWSRDGKIFLRKDEASRIIRINSIDDLSAEPE